MAAIYNGTCPKCGGDIVRAESGVYADAFGGDSGICVSCLFGCPPDEPDVVSRPGTQGGPDDA